MPLIIRTPDLFGLCQELPRRITKQDKSFNFSPFICQEKFLDQAIPASGLRRAAVLFSRGISFFSVQDPYGIQAGADFRPLHLVVPVLRGHLLQRDGDVLRGAAPDLHQGLVQPLHRGPPGRLIPGVALDGQVGHGLTPRLLPGRRP